MKKSSFKTVQEFKKFVYEPGESHFFYLCETHRNNLERKQDAVREISEIKEICDYPKCRNHATYEFFPNLATYLRRNQ